MRTFALALAASSLLAAAPALAQGKSASAPGHQPKVCLLTFASADALASGADSGIVKAQYVPLPIGQKLLKDPSTQALAYYGFGDLTAEQQAAIGRFYYPNGSSDPNVGVTETSDTETLCNAFAAAADADDDGDDD
jgi:hypothetical protein